MNIIEFVSVSKHYRMGEVNVTALDKVNFSVAEGDFVAITGPSGSGKSTMLNLMGCLDIPSAGEILVLGKSVASMSESELDSLRSRTFGMIFQSFNLVPVLTAQENVGLPLHLQQLSRGEIRQRAMAALQAVGLERFAGFKPDQLSGGQRQRVAIARALACRPKLMLADEPTASLDTENAMALVDLMKKLNTEQGVSFVFSTHDERLLQHVNQVVELHDGILTGLPAAQKVAAPLSLMGARQ
ncbi:ABC transporter ATP-binding protein [Janthinobacterium sp.]|uniref:ABC transporter ATP-binding protein n=1 Tax=Janthinobacterium sp. TaxID=1871054 RepID=UPI002587A0AB|nr:ABC transporter ATP-binding protein [Janthinobacterium sp.]MCX7293669.1 ABC transporter ATP-binding protein [Janthinobacterium sp.]